MTGKRYFKVLLALGFVAFAQSCAGTSSKPKAKDSTPMQDSANHQVSNQAGVESKATPMPSKIRPPIDSALAATNLDEIQKYIDDLSMWTYVERVIAPYETIDEAIHQDSIKILHRVIASYTSKKNASKGDASRLNSAIEFLLQKKADVTILNEDGEDVLSAFLKIGSSSSRTLSTWHKNQKHHSADVLEPLVTLFVEQGASLQAKDKNGITALEKIVDFASIDFIKALLQKGDSGVDIHGVLHIALLYNHNDLVQHALQNGAVLQTATPKGKDAFFHAVTNLNDMDLFTKVMDNTDNLQVTVSAKKGQTRNALHVLILGLSDQKTQKVYLDKIIYLLEKGIKVIEKDWMKAGEENSLIVLVLANSGLTYEKSERVCKMLIEQGANVNLITNLQSPLFILLYRNYRHPIESLLELFIEKGADVNFIFRETKTPLDLITHYLSSENELLKNKAIKINNLLRAKGAKLFTELEK